MKIRNGFVSNSSSSSFIVLLSDDFNIDAELSKMTDELEYHETTVNDVKRTFEKFKKDGYVWRDDDVAFGYDNDFYSSVYFLEEFLEDYVIASVDSGPDDGQIILADKDKIKKILGA